MSLSKDSALPLLKPREDRFDFSHLLLSLQHKKKKTKELEATPNVNPCDIWHLRARRDGHSGHPLIVPSLVPSQGWPCWSIATKQSLALVSKTLWSGQGHQKGERKDVGWKPSKEWWCSHSPECFERHQLNSQTRKEGEDMTISSRNRFRCYGRRKWWKMKKNLIMEDWRRCRQLLKVRIAPMMFLTNVDLLLVIPGCCMMKKIIFSPSLAWEATCFCHWQTANAEKPRKSLSPLDTKNRWEESSSSPQRRTGHLHSGLWWHHQGPHQGKGQVSYHHWAVLILGQNLRAKAPAWDESSSRQDPERSDSVGNFTSNLQGMGWIGMEWDGNPNPLIANLGQKWELFCSFNNESDYIPTNSHLATLLAADLCAGLCSVETKIVVDAQQRKKPH